MDAEGDANVDLFGSDDEVEEIAAPPAPVEEPAQQPEQLGEPLDVEYGDFPKPAPGTTWHALRLPAALPLVTAPFTQERYEEEQLGIEDPSPVHQQTKAVRWRQTQDPITGRLNAESNARIVRWSDGTLQLWVGDTPLDMSEQDIAGSHNFLFVRNKSVILSQGAVVSKMAVNRSSVAAVVGSSGGVAGVGLAATGADASVMRRKVKLVDPAETAAREKMAQQERQNEEEYQSARRRQEDKYGGPLSSSALEELVEDRPADGRAGWRRAERDDEEMAERRILQAKEAEHSTGRKKRR